MAIKPIPRLDKDSWKSFQWCLDNGIKVYVKHKSKGMYEVEVNDNGQITNSGTTKGELYGKEEVEFKVQEILDYYYKNFSKCN
jgi:hypothetical protein